MRASLLWLSASALAGCGERNTPTGPARPPADAAYSVNELATSGDNAVVRWNEVAVGAVLTMSTRTPSGQSASPATPSASALYVAIVQAAVYDATMAIAQTHVPYASAPAAPPGASVDAAVAAAAHDVLVAYFGFDQAQRDRLDAAYRDALAAIPDGDAEEGGIGVGRQAAADIIALRADDGRFAAVQAPNDGTSPGDWRRTASAAAVTPWTAQVRPFLINSPDQFRPEGPNSLTSEDYAAQLNETRLYGGRQSTAATTSLRTPAQTEIALFWTENTVGQYNRALRELARDRVPSAAASARLFAMTGLTGADAMITCWSTKYEYRFWRPVTAIRLADSDGNPATAADADWVPFSATANHPEYTSGHACLTGAISRALQEFLGTEQIDFRMDAAVAGTTVHHFATVRDLRTEVENARIYGGDHFRKGGSDGTRAGDHVAKWALKRFFQLR